MKFLKAAIICFLFLNCSLMRAENMTLVETDVIAPADSTAMSKNNREGKKHLNAVVQKLMLEAKQALKGGNYALANSTIERAIRIQRDNSWLWHNLAVLRHQQQHYAQAIQLALKSNDLSTHYAPKSAQKLQLSNWKLIHHSHLQLGEAKKAKKALKYIKNLSL